MMKISLIALALMAPVSAFADAPAADTAFAIPTEVLPTGKATGGKFLEGGFSVGAYKFFALNYTTGDASIKVFGAGKQKTRNVTKFRFLKSDDTVIASGKCLIRGEENSSVFGFSVDQKNSGLYKCEFTDLAAADYALEVVVPQFAATSVGGFMSIEKDEPHRWDLVKAHMRYKGVDYDAVPTELDHKREAFHHQPIVGYIISREGKPVGRVDFDANWPNKGTMTVPVAEADGREAVIFFASELLVMPDVYASSQAF